MTRSTLARIGLWAFAAGIFAWVFPNLSLGLMANVVTDSVIVVAAVFAAVGLPRAVDGVGNGPLRGGLFVVALAQFGQNVVTAFTKLDAGNVAPVLVVLASSVAMAIGIFRWRLDGWDTSAFPWLMAGFAGYAFEPLYYFVKGAIGGTILGIFTPGAVLVAAGAGLAAWAFGPMLEDVQPLDQEADVPAKVRRSRA